MAEIYSTTYNRDDCQIGIVHIGYGAFHRAHQAVYIDDYIEKTGDLRWGIAAVSLRPSEKIAQNNAQQGYVLRTTSPEGVASLRKVRPHLSFHDWHDDRAAAEALFDQPNVHAATVTVTESGYYTDGNRDLNLEDPAIKAEIAGAEGQTIFAFLIAGLRKRMSGIGAPITLVCCDNIRGNGRMLERNVIAYCKALGDTDLLAWIGQNVAFPNGMVDRITPRSTPEVAEEISAMLGESVTDPVHSETFTQWVLEDKFAGPFPALAEAGVEIVEDVDPYEEAKIRILNGSHTALVYFGALEGLPTYDMLMQDPKYFDFYQGFNRKEVLPGLPDDMPFDVEAYLDAITERFSNSAIADAVERISADGFSKFSIFLRPTLFESYASGKTPSYGLKAIASWYIFARWVAAGKIDFEYREPNWDLLQPMLDPANLDSFCTSPLLWDDLPQRFGSFPSDLSDTIKEMETTWPV